VTPAPLIQRPLAAVLAVACAAGVLALGFAPGMDLALRMTVAIAAVLGLLLAAGALRHHAMAERLRGANLEREQRFVSLLGIAVDAYWELDAAYRLTMLSRRVRDGSFVADDLAEPCEPWDLPHVQFDEDTLDSLRADLEAREPFRDVPLRVAYGTPAERHLLISGEPRFAPRGAFLGYWGVARDVSDDVHARGALEASELREREMHAERRAAEETVRRSEAHARLEREAILENASIGIALTRDQRFMVANRRFEQMFGWAAETLVGQPGRAVWTSDDDYAHCGREIGPRLARGEQVEIENTMARADGSTFLCRLLARAVDPTHPSRGGTIWIAEDVTERRRIEQALAKARDDAEAASRAKSAFLANTSHEIRTPLNGLVGLARLARQPGIDESRRRQYLDQIFDSAETLSTIISDILDLSKIEAGKLHVEAVPFDLHELLDTLQRGYRHLADARALALDLQIGAGVPATVLGDPVRVRQILSNYLNNALKFTVRGGICLAVRPTAGDTVRFEVHDSGPGIDAHTQLRLFHPFTQADESTTRRFGGTGLGLSICRQLAVLMEGRVGVDSEPGAGSCFWAELPLPRTQVPVQRSFYGSVDGSPLAGASVLMVEDNPVNMMIAVALLEQWGAQVTQASNGQQAVDAVRRAPNRRRPFDAVLMDVQMPVMSGHEATRILRRDHGPRELPIIALTAAALTSEREAALHAGMNDFLTKPIDAQRLHDTLVKVL
jgi:PAS domain S-box-containing protein